MVAPEAHDSLGELVGAFLGDVVTDALEHHVGDVQAVIADGVMQIAGVGVFISESEYGHG